MHVRLLPHLRFPSSQAFLSSVVFTLFLYIPQKMFPYTTLELNVQNNLPYKVVLTPYRELYAYHVLQVCQLDSTMMQEYSRSLRGDPQRYSNCSWTLLTHELQKVFT